MTAFPLTPEDQQFVDELTRQKHEALAFIARSEALLASIPPGNLLLSSHPLTLEFGRHEVVRAFVARITQLLAGHYRCSIDAWSVLPDDATDCAVEDLLALAVQALHGQSVEAAARHAIRRDLQRLSHAPWVVQDRTITMPELLLFYEYHWTHQYSLPPGQVMPLINALTCWATGALYADPRPWSSLFPPHGEATADDWFRAYPTPLPAVENVRYFENGRVDVTFATAEQARDFAERFGPEALP